MHLYISATAAEVELTNLVDARDIKSIEIDIEGPEQAQADIDHNIRKEEHPPRRIWETERPHCTAHVRPYTCRRAWGSPDLKCVHVRTIQDSSTMRVPSLGAMVMGDMPSAAAMALRYLHVSPKLSTLKLLGAWRTSKTLVVCKGISSTDPYSGAQPWKFDGGSAPDYRPH